eukprot:Seg3103.6 transcript_id=Seg3103.6/GoldUCD/mRNA.D3Y31 product="hypothetical protein" protein_id=Seg3103.6/GoldUCD/D3Y31
MFARIKGLFTKLKQKVDEDKTDKEYDVGVPPTDDVLQAELQDKRSKVAEHLEPVKANWDFIESILLWKNALPACICFFLISGVFWKFISMKLRRIALIFGGFLLANGMSGDLRKASWEFFEKNCHLQIKGEARLQFDFDELCLFIATWWTLSAQTFRYVQSLSTGCPPKFYCIIAVSLFSVLALFTYFPVLEFLYVMTCALFFYPSMYHYGIVDRIQARIDRLTQPILRHWENNRTKRTRKIERPTQGIRQEQIDDSEDEFSLDKNKFTSEILSSVVPEDGYERRNENVHDVIRHPSNEDEDYNEFYPESHFEANLTMPSMSKFDSLMEPYDEFHTGLKFPDYEDSSKMDDFNVLNAAANNLDTDEEVDDLPYETDGISRPMHGFDSQDFGDRPLSHPTNDNEIRHRVVGQRSTSNPLKGANPGFYTDEDEDMYTRAVEADFEFLEHEDVDDMDNPKNSEPSEKVDNEDVSYAKVGIASVSKWLGYE